MRKRINRLGPI